MKTHSVSCNFLGDEDMVNILPVKNTTLLYFILLEALLSFIAVSLPSLWYFVSGKTPERVLRSIRSMVSLRSNRSTGSKQQLDSEKSSTLASHTDQRKSDSTPGRLSPIKRDTYEIKVTSEVDIH